MVIDYRSLKRCGISYRELPNNFIQPKCSGRTPLCDEVLNDTWIGYADSTIPVAAKKSQYEAFIYRCEDEHFELDITIETNLLTIRGLEAVREKLNGMLPSERNKFKLDDRLGGTSTVFHQRAIRKIYGNKASEIIEGLKKNPSVAVPIVLKRLKAKDEEWREASKQYKEIWRKRIEKCHLRSLDHRSVKFKKKDFRYLRSKSLVKEIENFYVERQQYNKENIAAGEGTSSNNVQTIASGPHMTLTYKNKAMIEEACNLIIHHVKRQTNIDQDEKRTIKQLLKHFIPDLFATQRGDLSDDELENSEMGTFNGAGSNEEAICTSLPVRILLPIGRAECDGDFTVSSVNSSLNNDPDDSYALFFVNTHWYSFFRQHFILCHRLGEMYERCASLIAEKEKEKAPIKETAAEALGLKPKMITDDYEVEEYFPALIDMVKQVLDGNLDNNSYEDQLREMFGTNAFIAFTLDKVVQNIVRQLHYVVVDIRSIQCTEMFVEENKNGATGGPCASHHLRSNAEALYQKKAEQLNGIDKCYKIIIYKGEGKLTIELIVPDLQSDLSKLEPLKVRRCYGNRVNN